MTIIETHIVPAINEKIRLQEYAFSVLDNIHSRSALKKAIKKKLVLIDGEIATTGDWISPGQKIELIQAEITRKKVFKLNFEVLFEDQFIAVVHKPAGFPTNGNYFRTIENALPHNLKPSLEADALLYPEPVHRLDNPTAGILLVAKTKTARLRLHQDFSKKRIQKQYYALVHGFFGTEKHIITPIDDKPAETIISLEENLIIAGDKFSLIKAIPLTGRTHQIRIHLSSINHPIVCDEIYGIENEIFFRNKSLYLFAGEINFCHPILKNMLNFKITLPKRFRNLNQYRLH